MSDDARSKPQATHRALVPSQYAGSPTAEAAPLTQCRSSEPSAEPASRILFRALVNDVFEPLRATYRQATPIDLAAPNQRSDLAWSSQRSDLVGRMDLVITFLNRWKREYTTSDPVSVFPIFRLLVPHIDNQRVYELKESDITRHLRKAASISETSRDGMYLDDWVQSNPDRAPETRASDYGEVCWNVLKSRCMTTGEALTIDEINGYLDQLALPSSVQARDTVFEVFYHRASALEFSWLIRIMLKAMRMGLRERTLFKFWHADATAYYRALTSLPDVCLATASMSVLSSESIAPRAMTPCLPQLAARTRSSDLADAIPQLRLQGPEFYIEEKLDGERIMLHMQRDAKDRKRLHFRFYSRDAIDRSHLYGRSLDEGPFTAYLHGVFPDALDNVILDGEMVIWNDRTKAVNATRRLTDVKVASAGELNPAHEWPLYRAFDLIYVHNTSVVRYVLSERRRELARLVQCAHHRFEIHGFETAKDFQSLTTAWDQASERDWEGLVLKDPSSMYTCGGRCKDWIKIRRDYLDGFGETLDCVVIGALFGRGRRAGHVATFLCGLQDGSVRLPSGESEPVIVSFCKVGTGFTDQAYSKLEDMLENKWQHGPAPLQHPQLKLTGKPSDRPHVWIAPRDSVLIEIHGARRERSTGFYTGWTLRNPRFCGLLHGRTWKTGSSVENLMDRKAQEPDESGYSTEQASEDEGSDDEEGVPEDEGGDGGSFGRAGSPEGA